MYINHVYLLYPESCFEVEPCTYSSLRECVMTWHWPRRRPQWLQQDHWRHSLTIMEDWRWLTSRRNFWKKKLIHEKNADKKNTCFWSDLVASCGHFVASCHLLCALFFATFALCFIDLAFPNSPKFVESLFPTCSAEGCHSGHIKHHMSHGSCHRCLRASLDCFIIFKLPTLQRWFHRGAGRLGWCCFFRKVQEVQAEATSITIGLAAKVPGPPRWVWIEIRLWMGGVFPKIMGVKSHPLTT